jgi:hypothetical protein
MPYNMPEGWKLSDEETNYLSNLCFSFRPAIPSFWARWQPGLSAEAESAGLAAVAEIERFTVEEILDALRTVHGAKPDSTRRLELLYDENGRLPKYVSIKKACEYARVTERRMRQLIEGDEPIAGPAWPRSLRRRASPNLIDSPWTSETFGAFGGPCRN